MLRVVSRAAAVAVAIAAFTPLTAVAQQPAAPGRLSIERIFRSSDFRPVPVPSIAWSDGSSYVHAVENPAGGTDLFRVDPVTGESTPLVRANQLLGSDDKPVAAEGVTLSADRRLALVFHSTERVWRSNTRGSYSVVDLQTGRTWRTASRPGGQMFAKLSPDGTRVAFVRDNDLWVTELASGNETRLTTDGSATIINGTSDWVYEEELGLRDAFRWSPDGTRIAYWRFDQSEVKSFPLVDELSLYPTITSLRYPKAGETNSTVRIGVVPVRGGAATTWMDVGHGNDIYLARMEWLGSDSVVVQRLPRLQDRMDVLVASAATGGSRLAWSDTDSAYVDLEDLHWIDGDRAFLVLSDRSGWRQLYRVSRDGRTVRQLTRDGPQERRVKAVIEAVRSGGQWIDQAMQKRGLDHARRPRPAGTDGLGRLTPREDAVRSYLATGYEDAGSTLFEGVRPLPPASWREKIHFATITPARASPRISRRTWPAPAPTQRSRANSLVRWPTRTCTATPSSRTSSPERRAKCGSPRLRGRRIAPNPPCRPSARAHPARAGHPATR